MRVSNCGPCLSFFVGCLGFMTAGVVFAVPVYINAIKERFGYEQWIVDFIPALFYFGSTFLIPVGVLNERLGQKWCLLLGLLFTVTGYMWLWSTTFYVEFFSSAGGLQSLFHFVIGFGYGFYKIAVITTTTENFQAKHRAKAVAALTIMFSMGTILDSFLYGIAFVNGHKKDEGHQDLQGYYLCSAVINLLVAILCVFFLKPFPINSEQTGLVDTDHCLEGNDNADRKDITGWTLLKTLEFELFLWGSVLSGCVQLAYLNNVQTFLKSFHMEEYTILFVTVTAISQIVANIINGVVSDLLISKFPRTMLVLLLTIFQTFFISLSIFLSDKFIILLLTTITIAMADGCLWCTSYIVIRENFCKTYFGRNIGFYTTVISTCIIGSQELLGWMYQQSIPEKNQISCYGKQCFTWTFVLYFIFSFISIFLFIGIYHNHKK